MKKISSGVTEDSIRNTAAELVARLKTDVVDQSCVVFVGAGSTTERYRRDGGFYALIKKQVAISASDSELSFPGLMQAFCDQLDGGRHNRLLRQAISYLEWFCSPGEPNRAACSVTYLLATIPFFNRIVTTNWDPLLERQMDILVPVVEDRDLAFWDDKKRQVLKIHGCITRPHSVVATQSDYESCLSKNPLIFNKLKDLMATKTFIFMGYSMRDQDFREIWETITTVLGRFTKLAYAIDPQFTSDTAAYWRPRGIELVKTYDSQFLSLLRQELIDEELIPSEAFINTLESQRSGIVDVHINLDQNTNGGFASSMYQDGLLHELEEVISSSRLGTKTKGAYEADLSDARSAVMKATKADDFIEVAYWIGRQTVLEKFCARDETPIPRFFHPARMIPITRFVKG